MILKKMEAVNPDAPQSEEQIAETKEKKLQVVCWMMSMNHIRQRLLQRKNEIHMEG